MEDAPTTAAEAATIILDGVKADRWRILVGKDAHRLDELVRQSPEQAYDLDFFESFAAESGWRLGVPRAPRPNSMLSRSPRAPDWPRDPAAPNATDPAPCSW